MQTLPSHPGEIVADIESRSERILTDFGDGQMVWHRWSSPHPDRPPLILFHGGFGSWTHWIRVIEPLRAFAPVIAADLPGLGDSDDVAPPHTAEKLADILVQGLEQILDSGHPFHLIGFSFGGLLGSLVAATFGDQCLTFTAVGASGFGELHYIVKGVELPTEDMTAAETDQVLRKNLELLMFADTRSTDDLSLHIHNANLIRGRVRSRRISLSDALLQALPEITARIGGIWGELDATGGGLAAIEKRADIFRQLQPDAPFDIIDGAGHWVMYERPEAFTEVLIRHLQRLPA